MAYPAIATLSGTVKYNDNVTLLDGYVVLILAFPTGYTTASIANQLIPQTVANPVKVRIQQGQYDQSARIYQNTSLEPPNTKYVAYFYDNNDAQLGVTALFSITTSPFTITVPSFAVPTATVVVPVPTPSTPGTPQFLGNFTANSIIDSGPLTVGGATQLAVPVNVGVPNTGTAAESVVGTVAGHFNALLLANTNGTTNGFSSDLNFAVGTAGSTTTGQITNVVDNSGTSLAISTYNSGLGERVRITGSGNVGIGVPNPGGPLDVYSVASNGRVNVTFLNNGATGINSRMRLRLGSWTGFAGTDLYPYIESCNESAGGDLVGLALGTYAGAAIERLRITAAGNVGIGTASPTSPLHVVGIPVFANNAAAITGGLTAGAIYRTGANPDTLCIVH